MVTEDILTSKIEGKCSSWASSFQIFACVACNGYVTVRNGLFLFFVSGARALRGVSEGAGGRPLTERSTTLRPSRHPSATRPPQPRPSSSGWPAGLATPPGGPDGSLCCHCRCRCCASSGSRLTSSRLDVRERRCSRGGEQSRAAPLSDDYWGVDVAGCTDVGACAADLAAVGWRTDSMSPTQSRVQTRASGRLPSGCTPPKSTKLTPQR